MNEHHFGVSSIKPTRRIAARMERVAKKHGAWFIEATIPGNGYRRWFACQNYGDRVNSHTSKAVLDEIRALTEAT